MGTRLTDRISNSKLHEKGISIPVSRIIMKEMLKCLGHILWRKDDKLPKIVLVGLPSRAKRKVGHPPMGGGERRKERFKGNGYFLGGCKEEVFEWIGMEGERP